MFNSLILLCLKSMLLYTVCHLQVTLALYCCGCRKVGLPGGLSPSIYCAGNGCSLRKPYNAGCCMNCGGCCCSYPCCCCCCCCPVINAIATNTVDTTPVVPSVTAIDTSPVIPIGPLVNTITSEISDIVPEIQDVLGTVSDTVAEIVTDLKPGNVIDTII